jgi:2-keto-4-pentenoate hydratase/2-oxohepta-3-ene-1,7-dioic acid hydratase in catechol pathway
LKYISYTTGEEEKFGALLGERVVELTGQGFPPTLPEFISAGRQVWEAAAAYCQNPSGLILSVSQVRLLAPLRRPGKIIGIGLNYMDHCREQNIKVPERPVVFAKFATAINGPYDPITWDPALTDQVDYEVELGVVIGQTARRVTREAALDHVFGYTVVNDVSARDLQFSDSQWVRGKSLDSFCPFGPAIVTSEEIPDPQVLAIKTTVNGQVLQDSNTSEMIFGVRELISFLSQAFTLDPGDLILTGTPDGVGVFRKPQVFLRDGDQVVVEVERIGRLENRAVATCYSDD